ncbi:MAG TPA: tripartite tricarboxylate transporter substrate binding protein, partial [Burkholderiaceae bacterium]|nr:tripartite tricarboxylate transporter substrate binding protein [Burkholderiaceae bacterium]
LVQTPMAVANVKYKPENFRMVGLMASTYLMMLVRPDLPVTSVAEFAALAKKQGQRELSFGSVGRGSAYHLVAERFGNETGSKLLHVPYKGAQQLITDLAGGQIDMAFLAMGGPIPGLIKTGRFKAIGFAGPGRHGDFPSVQTMNESNVVKDFQFDLWGALMVPAATSEQVVSKLSSALQDALNQQQVRRDIEATGAVPAKPLTPSQAARIYSAEIARYQSIGKAINLRPE